MKKKALRERKHCALAVVRQSQNFCHAIDPLPGGENLISWRWSLLSPIYPVWWRSMHAILSYRGNRPTNKHTNRQDRLQYTAPLSLTRSVNMQSILALSVAATSKKFHIKIMPFCLWSHKKKQIFCTVDYQCSKWINNTINRT